jgi:hypothetical protein
MTIVYLLGGALLLAVLLYFKLRWLFNPLFIKPQPPQADADGILWKVHFELLFRSIGGGYVVQKIHVRERATTCDDAEFAFPVVNEEREFWEAWEVPAGQRVSKRRIDGSDFDDAFSYGVPKNALPFGGRGRAKLEVLAVVRFYEGVLLPQSFVAFNPATRAGEALSDAARPPFWGAGNSGVRHELTYEWEACEGEPTFTKSEVPKSGP